MKPYSYAPSCLTNGHSASFWVTFFLKWQRYLFLVPLYCRAQYVEKRRKGRVSIFAWVQEVVSGHSLNCPPPFLHFLCVAVKKRGPLCAPAQTRQGPINHCSNCGLVVTYFLAQLIAIFILTMRISYVCRNSCVIYHLFSILKRERKKVFFFLYLYLFLFCAWPKPFFSSKPLCWWSRGFSIPPLLKKHNTTFFLPTCTRTRTLLAWTVRQSHNFSSFCLCLPKLHYNSSHRKGNKAKKLSFLIVMKASHTRTVRTYMWQTYTHLLSMYNLLKWRWDLPRWGGEIFVPISAHIFTEMYPCQNDTVRHKSTAQKMKLFFFEISFHTPKYSTFGYYYLGNVMGNLVRKLGCVRQLMKLCPLLVFKLGKESRTKLTIIH